MNDKLQTIAKTFKSRGFEVYVCETGIEGSEKINTLLKEVPHINSIGFGNSVTCRTLGLIDIAKEYSQNIYVHNPLEGIEMDRKALTADFYFVSANAVSADGHIVNIDATGNRVASACFGPERVIYIIGRNKVADTLEDAIERAKSAAVKLAKMYNRKTPCTVTGKCEDCISPECICSVMTIHRKKPYGINATIIFVNEDLGI